MVIQVYIRYWENSKTLAKFTWPLQTSLCSFWGNLSGHFDRFPCNRRYAMLFGKSTKL